MFCQKIKLSSLLLPWILWVALVEYNIGGALELIVEGRPRLMRGGPAELNWVSESVKGMVELELDYCLVIIDEVVVQIILLSW